MAFDDRDDADDVSSDADRAAGIRATQEFYTRYATLYDLIARRTPGVARLRAAVVDALDPGRGDVVVEMGCGTGANFPKLRERVGRGGVVVGVDVAPGPLAIARERITRAGWHNVHVVRGDAARPPIADADAVLATFLSGMLTDPAAAVDTWADLVGPGGRLALLDLGRTARPLARPLNLPFRALVRASAPPGSGERHGASPTRALDRRLLAAHRELDRVCEDVARKTRTLGFARIAGGRVSGSRER
ncbi:class I SAM-dependent methyltransferase [Halobellus ordinarius]|uniref:class I SAM-dependent methyltransferase n=1 Tax=Halobellus ordinarius TaxID=3075120 RepID=UPI0028805735|nr:methyltransferase domain-containing protein [Halobellus sp. ZY16]